MTKPRLDFVLIGPPPLGMEGEIRDSFTKGHRKKGFDLLQTHLINSHRLHVYTVYCIINSLIEDEGIALLLKLQRSFYVVRTPKVLRNYIFLLINVSNNDLTSVQPAINKLANQRFPLELIAMNLFTLANYPLVIFVTKKKECRKNGNILEILMKSYMSLSKWKLAEKTANEVLLVDPQNISAISTLSRLSILDGDYNGALNVLREAEKINSLNIEVQSLKTILINYLDQLNKTNVPSERSESNLIAQSIYLPKPDPSFEELVLGEKVYPQRTNRKTNIKRKKRNSWDTIRKIELVIDDGTGIKVPPYYLIIQFLDGHTSAPVKLTPMHFSFFWFLIGQHLSGENWIARINEQEICKKIESIWKTVYHETFSESVYEYLDYDSHIVDMRKEDKLFEILRSFDSINAIISRNKGAWVIDPRNGRRRTYISSIRSALNSAVQDMNFPTDIFKSTRKKEIHGIEWQGLYKLNPSLVSQIKFVTLEI